VIIVEFETLDEAGVEHRGRRGAGRSTTPTDDEGAPGIVEGCNTFHTYAGLGAASCCL
jgi:hypothetical protein